MSETDALRAFRRWLDSGEGLAVMTAVARQLVRELRHLRLRAAMTRMGIDLATPFEVAADEVRSELYRFVLSKAERLAPPLAAAGAHAGGYLRQAFVNHCRETERQRGGDCFRFHYRRAAEALRRDARFATRRLKTGGLAYSLMENSRTIGPLSDEDLANLPAPADDPRAGVGYKDHAEHFWKGLHSRFGGLPVWVPVRELVRWLGYHGRLPRETPDTVPLSDAVAQQAAAPDSGAFDPAAVQRWAGQFAATLKPSDRRLFFLRYGRGLGFKAIAEDLEIYRSASGPHARMQVIERQLRDFIRSHGLPWLGPDDLDEEAFALFFDALLAALEKPAAAPSDMGTMPVGSATRHPRTSQ